MYPSFTTALLAFVISAQPLVSEDVLEPSIQNEVDHALAIAPTNVVSVVSSNALRFAEYHATNGLSATQRAISLISSQKGDGRWFEGTNDVTAVAVRLLRELSGEAPDLNIQPITPNLPLKDL